MAEHRDRLVRLPDGVLLLLAGYLDQQSLARWMTTAHHFYRLLVPMLYNRDRTGAVDSTRACSAFFWGCRTGNLHTLRRAVDTGVPPGCDGAFAAALRGEAPLATVSFLLDSGASPNSHVWEVAGGNNDVHSKNAGTGTFWPVLSSVLDAASRAPRWCPVPVVACFLAHGAQLRRTVEQAAGDAEHRVAEEDKGPAFADQVLGVWQAVLALPQVRGPRQRWVPGLLRPRAEQTLAPTRAPAGTEDAVWPSAGSSAAAGGRFVLRHDHCQHPDEPCAVALARVLLQHGADPNVVSADGRGSIQPPSADGAGTSLVALAICHPRRPVELLRCLADAGSATLLPMGRRAHQRTASPMLPQSSLPLLDMALADAVRLESLRHLPRGRNWDCYPQSVRCGKPDDVVRFLLERGTLSSGRAGEEDRRGDGRRTQVLLDRWDQNWRRYVAVRHRMVGSQKKKKLEQRQAGGGR